ncbi:hypothetical protein [Virgisporangium aliadipatigenens]|nr:hypothetical protein [Virgisporangium aliadipatigenens]
MNDVRRPAHAIAEYLRLLDRSGLPELYAAEALLDALCRRANASGGALLRIDPEGETLTVAAVRGYVDPSVGGRAFALAADSALAALYVSGAPHEVRGAALSPEVRELVRDAETVLAVPVRSGLVLLGP